MSTNLDVRVYPIDEPKGNTLAFASVALDDLAAIRGIRVVDGAKGLFVTMPQSQDNTGIYHDVAFPLNKELRQDITTAVLSEFELQATLAPEQRGYDKPEHFAGGRSAEDINLDVKVFPIDAPRGDTLAFASAALDDSIAIRGIRVVNGERGMFVSMPQSKDKDGEFHDIAFPLSGDVRKAISHAVLAEYRQQTAERKQSMGERLANGAEEAARYAAQRKPAMAASKQTPGLGD